MIRSQVWIKEKEENDWWKEHGYKHNSTKIAQIRFPDGSIYQFDNENIKEVKNGNE